MRINKLRLAILFASCFATSAAFVVACSSDDTATSTKSSPDSGGLTDVSVQPATDSAAPTDAGTNTAATVACTALASARCAKFDACANGTGTETRYGDSATCLARLTTQCLTGLGAPNTGATPATTQTCADAISAQSCATFFGVLDAPEACAPQPGTDAIGAACAVSAQCASGFCNVGPHSACGVCAAVVDGGVACGPSVGCARGFVCTGAATDAGTCVVPGGSGARCGTGAPCDALLHCQVDLDAGADAGDAAAPTTGSCEVDVVTVGGACAAKDAVCGRTAGLTCTGIGTARTCTVLTVAPATAACGVIDGGAIACSASGSCAIVAGSKSGACEAAVADGMPCALDGTTTCLAPAKCVDNGASGATCQPLSPAACH